MVENWNDDAEFRPEIETTTSLQMEGQTFTQDTVKIANEAGGSPLLCVDTPDADLAVVERRLLRRELFIRASSAVHRPEPEPEMRVESAISRRGEGRMRSKERPFIRSVGKRGG